MSPDQDRRGTTVDASGHQGLARLASLLGYKRDMVRWGFPVWLGARVVQADMVAFARPQPEPQDQTTSALAGFVVDREEQVESAIAIATALAAPAAALADAQGIDLWSIGGGGRREHMRRLPFERLDELPPELADQLGPRNLLSAKRSTYQQTLFPTDVAGLLAEARSQTANRLTEVVEHAATQLARRRPPAEAKRQRIEIEQISRLLVGAMAARMVSDKVEVERDQPPAAVLELAQQRFPHYFAWTAELKATDRHDLLWTIEELGRDVSYAGLDPTVVASVYESAILDSASRAKFGVYYTPPALASRMLALLPFEEIDPANRHVLDPTCGSGTFLVAAYERLRDIAPCELDLVEVHEDTSHRLSGIDIDPLAVEIARLALLLNAMPAGNGWQVECGDTLDPALGHTASVVVSNPPWGDIRSDKDKHRAQLADRFVRRMLTMVEANGLLAVVLPAGWLSSRTSRELRRTVEEECGMFEIWCLPQNTFPRADIDTAVMLAQRDRPAGSYVFRRVRRQPDWQSRFLEQQRAADENYLAGAGGRLQADTWMHGPLDTYREVLRSLPTLDSIALIGKGPVPTPPAAKRGGSGDSLWLRKIRDTRAYAPVPRELLVPVHFPEEFEWRRGDGAEYRRPKVMVSGVRNPDIPWRLKVLPDLEGGIIPRESACIVVPTETGIERVYALCALLGSSLASCWIDSLSTRSIPVELLKTMPVPAPGAAWEELAKAGQRLVALAAQERLGTDVLVAVDRLVTSVYGLPPEAFTRLEEHFAGVPAPEGGVRYPAHEVSVEAAPRELVRSFGTVLDLAPEALRIWIAGVTNPDGEWVALPPGLPGSQLVSGATFEVLVDTAGGVEGARFEFQPEAYRDLPDLMVTAAVAS